MSTLIEVMESRSWELGAVHTFVMFGCCNLGRHDDRGKAKSMTDCGFVGHLLLQIAKAWQGLGRPLSSTS
jgi:hypothetical protein